MIKTTHGRNSIILTEFAGACERPENESVRRRDCRKFPPHFTLALCA